MTNLPAEVSAILSGETSRDRWRLEGPFQRLTDLPHREGPALSYPRAAFFAFAMAVVAGNAVALLEGNRRAVQGAEGVEARSPYALGDAIAPTPRGMRIASPPATWSSVRADDAATRAGALKEVAAHVRVSWRPKTTRGPKEARTVERKSDAGSPHVPTRRLLDQGASRRSPPRHSPTKAVSSKSGGSQ